MATSTGREAPSTAAIATATAIIAGAAGYLIGQASSLGLLGASTSNSRTAAKATGSDSEDDEDRGPNEQLGSFPDHSNEECKLVLVVRTDLGMSSGEIA
jgi:PTH2 family peptidyl-tRNA hydrolase